MGIEKRCRTRLPPRPSPSSDPVSASSLFDDHFASTSSDDKVEPIRDNRRIVSVHNFGLWKLNNENEILKVKRGKYLCDVFNKNVDAISLEKNIL